MKKNLKRLTLSREYRYNRKDRELYLLMRAVMKDMPRPFIHMAEKYPIPKSISDGTYKEYSPFPMIGISRC